MNNYLLPFFIVLLFNISTYYALPTFEITGVQHMETRCDYENGFFQFQLLGKGTGINEEIRITFPLKEPNATYAICYVKPSKMNCTMDSLVYDLSGVKRLVVSEEPPVINNMQFVGWKEYFIPERRCLNSATNCYYDGEHKEVEEEEQEQEEEQEEEEKDVEEDEFILTAYEAEEIEIFGCFGKRNNFGFQLNKMKEEKTDLDSIDHDLYFDIMFSQPSDKKALCVMTRGKEKDIYKIRCSIDYGGMIEVGKEASGIVKLGRKKLKIVFRGLLISPTIVDECTKDKNNF